MCKALQDLAQSARADLGILWGTTEDGMVCKDTYSTDGSSRYVEKCARMKFAKNIGMLWRTYEQQTPSLIDDVANYRDVTFVRKYYALDHGIKRVAFLPLDDGVVELCYTGADSPRRTAAFERLFGDKAAEQRPDRWAAEEKEVRVRTKNTFLHVEADGSVPVSAARRAQSTGCAQPTDGLRPPRLPSAKAEAELRAYGPAQWLTVQQCGWKGPQCMDGTRCDLLPELLAQ